MTLQEIFNAKMTENGDLSFSKVSMTNNLLNILFMTEYYQNHLNEVNIGTTERDKLFARFIRDPRGGGLGRRDLGRVLMAKAGCSFEDVLASGRADDLFIFGLTDELLAFLKKEIEMGNELVKKWMPRYSSQNLLVARQIAKAWGLNKQQYGKFIKAKTVEDKLSRHNVDDINFEHIPSLAMLKYAKAFANREDTAERYNAYLEGVKNGTKKMNVSTMNVYDIYKNRFNIDPNIPFSQIEKAGLNCIPIVDTSGSMYWGGNDAIGKALAIGHYLAKCSTYLKDTVITFSSNPTLITLGKTYKAGEFKWDLNNYPEGYMREIENMVTGDCSNTDLGKVMDLLQYLDDMPEYLVILSDMEFDSGSSMSKNKLMNLWKSKGYKTKIVWWNLNSRNTTCPEMDNSGNVFMSGYNPMLLKFMNTGFNGEAFLDKLLEEYKKKINA